LGKVVSLQSIRFTRQQTSASRSPAPGDQGPQPACR
jgi:hypothetical protein